MASNAAPADHRAHTSQVRFMPKYRQCGGGWSSDLFASLGITLPVALEPVYAANFLVSAQDIPESLPIVAIS